MLRKFLDPVRAEVERRRSSNMVATPDAARRQHTFQRNKDVQDELNKLMNSNGGPDSPTRNDLSPLKKKSTMTKNSASQVQKSLANAVNLYVIDKDVASQLMQRLREKHCKSPMRAVSRFKTMRAPDTIGRLRESATTLEPRGGSSTPKRQNTFSPYITGVVSAHKKRQESFTQKIGGVNLKPVLDGKSEYQENSVGRDRLRFAIPEIYQMRQFGKRLMKDMSSRSVKEVDSTAVSAYVKAA